MNRREWIKTLAAGGAALGATAWLPALSRQDERAADAASYFLCTDRPDADLKRLRRIADLDPAACIVTSRRAEAYRQDLAVLSAGILVDAARTPRSAGKLAAFAESLRNRSAEARFLLSIEPRSAPSNDRIIIEQDGVVQEVIDPAGSFRSIDVEGPAGRTSFELRDGLLNVTSASCRHRNCELVGAAGRGRIVCAPNRLVATLPSVGTTYGLISG